MNLTKVVELLRNLLTSKLGGRKFTGTIVIVLHCRDGSVGKCNYDIPEKVLDLTKDNQV